MHVNAERLLASLKLSGLRMTKPRKAVCQVLAESHDEHLTAADLHRRVEEVAGTKVDPSTIYRTIDVLSEAGYLHHVHFGHGPGVVHLSEESQHHHIVCEACGRTVDLDQEELGSLAEVLDSHGYTSGSVHFAIIAHCQTCT
jgi:Fur family ferric uptake transcriptional regulator